MPGVAPESLVRRARRAINHSLGAGFERSDVVSMNARSFCEELVADPRLLRLATNRPLWSCVRSLLGDGRIERPRECQIALRFPRPEGTPRTLDAPHVDGYHTPDKGLPDDGIVRDVIRRCLGEERRAGTGVFQTPREPHQTVLEQLGYAVAAATFETDHEWSLRTLLGYLYSTSFASPDVLAGNRDRFEADLMESLLAFDSSGQYRETLRFHLILARPPIRRL